MRIVIKATLKKAETKIPALSEALKLVESCKPNKEDLYDEKAEEKIKGALAIISQNYVHENTMLIRHHLNSARMALDYFLERFQDRSKASAEYELGRAIELMKENQE